MGHPVPYVQGQTTLVTADLALGTSTWPLLVAHPPKLVWTEQRGREARAGLEVASRLGCDT